MDSKEFKVRLILSYNDIEKKISTNGSWTNKKWTKSDIEIRKKEVVQKIFTQGNVR